jgi:hypothetical protein
MASQFDELAKAIARGASRRTVLRGIFGGLVGAVAASLLPSGRSESVEAGAPSAPVPGLRQSPSLNQRIPFVNQYTRPAPGGPVVNQLPVRLNQGPPGLNPPVHLNQVLQLNQAPVRLNQITTQMNQQRQVTQAGSSNGHRPPYLNQHHPTANQTDGPHPRWNQRPGWNQRLGSNQSSGTNQRFGWNQRSRGNQSGKSDFDQRQAWLNQIRSRFSQTHPNLNQHRRPVLNTTRHP